MDDQGFGDLPLPLEPATSLVSPGLMQEPVPAPVPSLDDLRSRGYTRDLSDVVSQQDLTDMGYSQGDITTPSGPLLDELHRGMSQQWLSDGFLSQSPDLPHPTMPQYRDTKTGQFPRQFNGDESISRYAKKARQAYERALGQGGADAELIQSAGEAFEKQARAQATGYSLRAMAQTYPGIRLSPLSYMPFTGQAYDWGMEHQADKSEAAISEGKGDLGDYRTLAAKMARQSDEENAGQITKMLRKLGHFGQAGLEFSMFGPAGEAKGTFSEGIGTALRYSAATVPVHVAEGIADDKPLTQVAKEEAAGVLSNIMFSAIGQLGASRPAYRGLVSKAAEVGVSASKLIVAGEVADDANYSLGLSGHKGPLATMLSPGASHEEKAQALQDFWTTDGAATALEIVTHMARGGEKLDPQKVANALVAKTAHSEMLKQTVAPEQPAAVPPKAATQSPAEAPPEVQKPLQHYSDEDIRGIAKSLQIDARGSRETLLKRLYDMDQGRTLSSLETINKPPEGTETTQGNAPNVPGPPISAEGGPEPASKEVEKTAPTERRVDAERRKAVAEMSPEEMKKELLTSPVTGLPNRRAFDDAGPAEAVGYSDADGLKALNDKFGYEAGNNLLKAKAEALKEAGIDAYHEKGDEFLHRAESEPELRAKLDRARSILRDKVITARLKDGTVKHFKGADFSYGTGKDIGSAETGLKAHKSEREARGERARGELRGITEVGPEGRGLDSGGAARTDNGPEEAARPSLVERMRQNAEQPVQAPGQPAQEPRPEDKGGPPQSAVIEKLQAAGAQAKALAEKLARQEPESAPGAEPPGPRTAKDWRKNVVRLHATAYLKTMGEALRDPSSENMNKAANVLEHLSRMARSRGLDPGEMIRKEMPELSALLEKHHDVLEHLTRNPHDLPHNQEVKDAIRLAERSSPDPSSLRRGVESSLQGAESAARSHAPTEEPAPGNDQAGAGTAQTPGGAQADRTGATSANAGRGETDSNKLGLSDLIKGESGALNVQAVRKFFGFKDEPTGIKNESAARERQKASLPPVAKPSPLGHSYPELREKVLKIAKEEPTRIDDLIDKLKKNPRPITDEEDAMLLHRQNDMRNEYAASLHRLVESRRSGDAIEQNAAQTNEDAVREKLKDVTDVAKQAGTATARGLAARRMMVNQDFSLANMEMQSEAAKGRPLTPEEKDALVATHIKVARTSLDRTDAEAALSAEGKGIKGDTYPAMQKAQVEAEAVKNEWRRSLETDRQANQPVGKRIEDLLVKIRRASVISSPVTMAKIVAASAERMLISPMEEAAGAVWSAIPGIAKISAMAPREGRGLNLGAEKAALVDGLTKGFSDAWKSTPWKAGHSELDTLYGDKSSTPRSWLDWVGELHAAGKAPAVRAEFSRSLIKRIDAAAAQGQDASSPAALQRFGLDAYKDSQAAKFQQQNWLADGMKQFLKPAQDASMGERAGKFIGRMLLPVVRVPTNLVFEAAKYAFGAPVGLGEAGLALARGVEKLKPAEADAIMQHLKKGSLGAAVLLAGYFLPNAVGGFYSGKRKKEDVEAGAIGDVPSFVLHNPLLETLQMGATARRAYDQNSRKGGGNVATAVGAGLLGLAEEVPLMREASDVGRKAMSIDPKVRGQYFGELAKSLAVPQLVQWLAGRTDRRPDESSRYLFGKPVTGSLQNRRPVGVLQHVQEGIPGLRNMLPARR